MKTLSESIKNNSKNFIYEKADKNKREVWLVDKDRVPSMLIDNIEDYKYCMKKTKTFTSDEGIKNVEDTLKDYVLLIHPEEYHTGYRICQNKDELKHFPIPIKYLCDIDIHDFSYDYMEQLPAKYNK